MTCRKLASILAGGVCIVAMAAPANAQAQTYNIKPGSLKAALDAYGLQSGRPIIYKADQVRGLRSQGASGSMSSDAALNAVLAGTAFRAKADSSGAVGIVRTGNDTAGASQSAPATTDASTAAAADGADVGLGEIIVMAQRREQKAQDVPIAVAAFNSDQMSKMGITSSNDLPSILPGLSNAPTPIRTYFYLRGVGSNSLSTSPSVLTYIDGVYQPFNPASSDFSGVERIEIAKGPQGTLFGRNATAGVIQITTANPLKWQGIDAQIGYANYDTISGKIYGSAKFSDNAAASISAFYNNQQEGWGTNVVSGKDVFTSKRYGARGKFVVELDDSFTATLVGDYSYSWGQVAAGVMPAVGTKLFDGGAGTTFTLPGKYDISSDIEPFGRNREGGVALTLEKRLGDIKLLSISSYRRGDEKLRVDSDATAAPYFNISVDIENRAFAQEFQVSGDHGPFNWVAGLFYFDLDKKPVMTFTGIFPSFTFPFQTFGAPFALYSNPTIHAYAGYAQGTVEVLPSTNLTLGARYTIEKHRIEGYSTGSPILSPGSAGTQKKTFKKPTFRISLDHKFTPDVMAYASYNRGFNAGFFNQAAVEGFRDAEAVDPEGIDAYEIGLKTDWFDRRLQINAAAFLYDYTNLQQQIYQFGTLFTLNAASARIKGIDLDIVARPTRDLTLSLSTNYIDSKYLSYPLAPNGVIEPNGEFVYQGSLDAKGNRLVQAPKYGVQATASYRLRTSIGTFDTTGNVNYQSRMFADPQNRFPIRARTLLGITEQWTSNDGRMTATAWVKNLTNKRYDVAVTLQDHVGLVGLPGSPRTYGLTLGYRY